MEWKSVDSGLPPAGELVEALHPGRHGPVVEMCRYHPLALGVSKERGWHDRFCGWVNSRGELVMPVTHWRRTALPDSVAVDYRVSVCRQVIRAHLGKGETDRIRLVATAANAINIIPADAPWLLHLVDELILEAQAGWPDIPVATVIRDGLDKGTITCKKCGAVASVVVGHRPWSSDESLKSFRPLCDVHRKEGSAPYRYRLEVRTL